MISPYEALGYHHSLFVVNALDPRSFVNPSSCSLLPYTSLPTFHVGHFSAENDEKINNSNTPSISSRNKLGRSYNPGRPLGMADRQKILDLYEKGHKISHIARQIGVTHSCVSKIMTRYRRTGSMFPRSYTGRAKSLNDSDTASESEGKEEEKSPEPTITNVKWEAADFDMTSSKIDRFIDPVTASPPINKPLEIIITEKKRTPTLHTIESILYAI